MLKKGIFLLLLIIIIIIIINWFRNYFNKDIYKIYDNQQIISKNQQNSTTNVYHTALIIYSSEKGTGQTIAYNLENDFNQQDYKTDVLVANDVCLEDLNDYDIIIIIMPTYGQGEFPINGQSFWKSLSYENQSDIIKDIKYSIFGLGNSSYYYFCNAAKLLDSRMKILGAITISPIGFGDELDKNGYEDGLNIWLNQLKTNLKFKTTIFTPSIKCLPFDGKSEIFKALNSRSYECVENINMISYNNNNSEILENNNRIFLSIKVKSETKYSPGDVLMIHPNNDINLVTIFMNKYDINEQNITIQSKNKVYPSPISVTECFHKYMDIFGRPTMYFCDNLSSIVKNENLKNELKTNKWYNGDYNFAQILLLCLKTDETKLTLNYLLELIPPIKMRMYSIASSYQLTPDIIELCVSVHYRESTSSKKYVGLCSSFLMNLKIGDKFDGKIKKSTINFSTNEKQPCILCCVGSGIAPLMSLIRDRYYKKKQGETIGKNIMYFGNRNQKTEFLYENDFKKYIKNNTLILKTAFSRDGNGKIYIQDLMKNDLNIIYDFVIKQNGSIYICGSKNLLDPIRNIILDILKIIGKYNDEDAEKMLFALYKNQRFYAELW